MRRIATLLLLLFQPLASNAETPEEWVALGARVHGALGAAARVFGAAPETLAFRRQFDVVG